MLREVEEDRISVKLGAEGRGGRTCRFDEKAIDNSVRLSASGRPVSPLQEGALGQQHSPVWRHGDRDLLPSQCRRQVRVRPLLQRGHSFADSLPAYDERSVRGDEAGELEGSRRARELGYERGVERVVFLYQSLERSFESRERESHRARCCGRGTVSRPTLAPLCLPSVSL